jgi:glycosyltransferase involved in cell wall biosynthesis
MNNGIRILFVTSSLKGGGAENHILNLCIYLKSISLEPSVITLSQNAEVLEAEFDVIDVPVHRVPVSSIAGILRPARIGSIREILRLTDPHLVHGHLFHGEIAASIISSLSGLPMVTTRHSSGLEFNGRRRLIARLASRRIDAAIVVSRDSCLEASATGVPEGRITIIHNGVDARRFPMLEGDERMECKRQMVRELFPGDVPSDPILVGAAGALKNVKNYPLFIGIASRILSRDPALGDRVRFVIAGEGPLRDDLERMVGDAGLSEHVAMPGYLKGLEDFFPCIDIFLVTSFSEGVPIALLEAMSSGAACVASDTGDIGVVMGDAGVTVGSGDEDRFVDVVSRFIYDEGLRKSIGRMARVRILEHFDLEIWGDRIMEVYRSVLD